MSKNYLVRYLGVNQTRQHLIGQQKRMTTKNILLIISAIAILGLGATSPLIYEKLKPGGETSGLALSTEEIRGKVTEYLKENVSGGTASVVSIVENNDLYEMILDVNGQEFTSYATKNGKFLFPQAIDLDEFFASLEVSTRETPDVKLFVMTYCPYGLQAQKGLLPVWELLKDKANFGIYFVDYVMHDKQEIDENVRQYCIQKQEPEKIVDYLKCFTIDGNFEGCLANVGIDQEGLLACVSATDEEFEITKNYDDKESWLSGYYPRFMIDSDLNEKYDVGGSPTLVINDKVISLSDRSPEGFKKVICAAFNQAPEECLQELSSQSPVSSFGAETGDSSGGSCE